MKLLFVLATLAVSSLALPVNEDAALSPEVYTPCPGNGIFGTMPVCCEVSVIGAADFNCRMLSTKPRSPAQFKGFCGARTPQCCAISPSGGIVDTLCQSPSGFS